MKNTLLFSVDASLLVQTITLIFGFIAAVVPSSPPLGIIINIENFVQIIEFIFYIWYRFTISFSTNVDVTWVRYFDWAITTPIMLISTALFFEYQRTPDSSSFNIWKWLSQYHDQVWLMVLANALMLLFGFLQELNIIDIFTSSLLGFTALGISFWFLRSIRNKTIQHQHQHQQDFLYWAMFFVWSLYGVAAVLPTMWKNVSYNILDLFSKNFYGLYISYLILSY
jgi:bacteriorhodopsin